MRTLLVNFKNYPQVMGQGSVRLAQAAERAAKGTGVRVIVAPPIPMLALVASKTKARVYSQTVGTESGEKTTGAILPDAVRAAGASGTILNHSESRGPAAGLSKLVPRLSRMGLELCICAQTSREAAKLASLEPEYVAIEPPELIGTGVAVSTANPELIRRTVAAVRRTGYGGGILCGAGIVSGSDVRRAVDLGADGVLVASSVVNAPDWESKLGELARSLM